MIKRFAVVARASCCALFPRCRTLFPRFRARPLGAALSSPGVAPCSLGVAQPLCGAYALLMRRLSANCGAYAALARRLSATSQKCVFKVLSTGKPGK